VHEAATKSLSGAHNCLTQREKKKLRQAQSWIRGPTSTGHSSSTEESIPNVTPSTPNKGVPPTTPEMSSVGPSSPETTRAQPETQTTNPSPSPPTSSSSGESPQLLEVSADGTRRFVPFVLSSSGRLGPQAANFFAELCNRAKRRGHDYTAFGVSGSDDAVAASVRKDASWANRNFPAWAKQYLSLAVCATKALAIDRILRNDSIAGIAQRGTGAPHRPPGVVGYCQKRRSKYSQED
jgi:hypothetical protein